MTTVPRSSPKQGFYIEVGCPGCGGKIQIEADFFVTKCTHCGSPLRMTMPDTPPAYLIPNKVTHSEARFKIDRQLKSMGLPLTGQELEYKQVYYPYWKVDAMLLRMRNRKEEVSIIVDDSTGEETIDYKKNTSVNLGPYQISVAASNQIDGIPDSLGIRGQTIKVVPFSNSRIEEGFDYLDVRRAPAEVVKTIELSLEKMNTIELAEFGKNVTKIFNPQTALLYFPFCIAEDYAGAGYRRYVLDGLTGRLLSRIDSEEENIEKPKSSAKNSKTGNLTQNLFEIFNKSESLETAIEMVSDAGLRLDYSEMSTENDNPQIEFGSVSITFHRCENCGTDLPTRPSCIYICSNCGELTCLDKQFKIVPKVFAVSESAIGSQYFPFWVFSTTGGRLLGFQTDNAKLAVPAFRIPNFEALYRLSRKISTAADHFETAEIDNLDERFAPVDILPTQAIALANVIYYRYSLEKTNNLPKKELMLLADTLVLQYIPFKAENYFFVDSVLKSVTFEKKLVSV